MKRNYLQCLVALTGILVLIFDSDLALQGGRSGIDLCIKTVIPSLFPFFVFSLMLSKHLTEVKPCPLYLIARYLRIYGHAAPVLIPAFLGGYPVGAKCVGDLYQRKQISQNEAERLLSFCSNAGPSFLFGMVSGFFSERKMIWLLWLIHIFSAVLTSMVIPCKEENSDGQIRLHTAEEKSIIMAAAAAMLQVCCWVVMFRVILSFLKVWFFWIFPAWLQVLFTGFLELTNGCCELHLIPDTSLRFVLCSCMLAFGGLCVVFQTVSVTKGLSIGSYMKGKLIQTLFPALCALGSWLVFRFVWNITPELREKMARKRAGM